MPPTKNPTTVVSTGAAFAELLVKARRERGWSQDALANRAGVNRSTILRWEAGVAFRPDPGALKAVCRALGIDQISALKTLGYIDEAQPIGCAA